MKFSRIITISSLLVILFSYMRYNKINIDYTLLPPENVPNLSCQQIPSTRLM